MNKKRLMALMAAAVMIMSFAGCSGGDNSSNSGTSGTSQSAAVSGSVLKSDTPLDAVVVKFDNEALNITFGDFLKEYKYYLASGNVTDDTIPELAQTLTQRREYIANYLVNSRIIFEKAEQLGFTLTEEENKKVDEDTEKGIENMKDTLKLMIKAENTEGGELSEEELTKRAEERYLQITEDCGLTYEDFRAWQEEMVIQNKLVEHANSDFSLDYSEAEKQVESYISTTKANYEKDPSSYDFSSSGELWIPDGSKAVDHVLLTFDDETITEINKLRSEEKADEAEKLRTEAAEKLSDKVKEITDKIAAGEDFDDLKTQYSQDTDTTLTYVVVPGTKQYMEEFTQCALSIEEIGGTASCVTDYGYHIVKFVEIPEATAEEKKEQTDMIYDYLVESYKTQNFNKLMKEWRSEYKFEINRDILLLGEEDTSVAE